MPAPRKIICRNPSYLHARVPQAVADELLNTAKPNPGERFTFTEHKLHAQRKRLYKIGNERCATFAIRTSASSRRSSPGVGADAQFFGWERERASASGVEVCYSAANSGRNCMFAVQRAALKGTETCTISIGVINAIGGADTCISANQRFSCRKRGSEA